jgi:hypothetical protein
VIVRVQSPDDLAGTLGAADGPVTVEYPDGLTGRLRRTLLSPAGGRIGVAAATVTLN